MAQLSKKTLLIKDVSNSSKPILGTVKLQKNSIFKACFNIKNLSFDKSYSAVIISSNMPMLFYEPCIAEFNMSLPVETHIDNIVVIIYMSDSLIAAASTSCDQISFSGYMDTIKNLKGKLHKPQQFFNENEHIEIVKNNFQFIIPQETMIKKIAEQNDTQDVKAIPDIMPKDLNKENSEKFFAISENLPEEKEKNKVEDETNFGFDFLKSINISTNDDNNKNPLEKNFNASYTDTDILLQEDSTLGDNLKIAEFNYFELNEPLTLEPKIIKPYYEKIKNELEELFKKHNHEILLEKLISQSKFCKIIYEENKYYVVGLIYENHVPQFICYGIPSYNKNEPPRQLKGFSSYIPTNPNNPKELGYWIMYQSAEDGSTIYPE